MEFERNGIVVIPDVISAEQVALLREELVSAIDEDSRNRPEVFDAGMVHNCMFRGVAMREALDIDKMNSFVSKVLTDTFIVYAYQSSSLSRDGHGRNSGLNYGSRVHVDSPRFIPGYCTNVGVILALDDFTESNGATYYVPASHKQEKILDDEEFYAKAERALCKAGDMVVFHGRLNHAAGQNTTNRDRHALTINFCRSYMRQRFDFPKMLSADEARSLSENTKKLLGWNVRMPTSLEEFYLPEAERLYKPGQG